ncbi:alpha/beta fold hydrolase [Paenibacillus sacheonensis]|uniref:Alpha/beta fold hydrolase n=2 Tax=Paenibacillus sacheonensis TaxID=742054 RepID=A0A7X4YQM9_9BACL|nr:alpha/beta fold hydrolase [Paenibacillus sacheonensis]
MGIGKKKKRTWKRIGTTIGALIGIVIVAVAGSYIHHKVKLNQEARLFQPLGRMVAVDGHQMSVYTEGSGPATLVFLAGGGTVSPILDFRSLYSRLSDAYRVAVVERVGYGFSEAADVPRDLDTVLEETRGALRAAGEKGPYILFPHSMSGLEALYWAQKYPEEVSGIVGLDPAVPGAYADAKIPNKLLLELFSFGAKTGITRFIPALVQGEPAHEAGTLTAHDKEIYKAVYYRRTETRPMITEIESVKDNARQVNERPLPQVPMLFFTSNGKGTGIDTADWQHYQIEFLTHVNDSEQVVLDCGHYVQDFKYEQIARESKAFIEHLMAGSDASESDEV